MPGFTRDLTKRRSGYNGNKPIQARWRHPRDPRIRREKSFPNKKLAREWMADEDSKALHGTWTDPHLGHETLASIASEWQESGTLNSSPKTRLTQDSILRVHVLPTFGERRIASIDKGELQKWVNRLNREPNTVHNIFAVLRMVMGYAVEERRIAFNPCGSVKLPAKPAADPQPLDDAQLARVIETMPDEQARVAVLIAAYMGLRAGEQWALRRSSVNFLKRELSVVAAIKEINSRRVSILPPDHERLTSHLIIGPTKTYAKRTLEIPEDLVEQIAALIPSNAAPDAFIFTGKDGSPIRHNKFYRHVYLANMPADITGKQRRWHSLRHTCASFLIDSAGNDRELAAFAIKEYLGHKKIQTTLDIYASMLPSGRAAVAASMNARYRAAQTTGVVQPLRSMDQR